MTSIGLPVAPDAVIRMPAVRDDAPVLAVYTHAMVPASVPLVPDVIDSQLSPAVTAAVHGMAPVPVLETLNVVVPATLPTLWVVGVTESTGCETEER